MTQPSSTRWLLGSASAGLLLGAAAWLAGRPDVAGALWAVTTIVSAVPLGFGIFRDLRRGEMGVDLIAVTAMAGAVAVGEYLAGAVVALMMSGGLALESRASQRAQKELRALLERAPRAVHRYEDSHLVTHPPEDVGPGDLLLVKSGEIVPVDGLVSSSAAVLDESALTGESAPVTRREGDRVASGVANAGAGFDLRASASAADSTYAGIVRLVHEAQASKAPFVRLANRYAAWFLPATFLVAALAWILSGDPVRALAVLVVATPCPLILAAPIAILSGVSRCTRGGMIVKGGGALEALSHARILLLDKTGTLTTGAAVVSEVEAFGSVSREEILRLAACVDQVSAHVLAAAIVRAARESGHRLAFPSAVQEEPGQGIRGEVDGRLVALGRCEWIGGGSPIPPAAHRVRRRTAFEGSSAVFVGIEGIPVGAIIVHDPVRPDAARTIRALRRSGIRRIVMVTGDHPDVAETVGIGIGADLVLAERSPAEKVEAVGAERARGKTVMVGDGINDAPALAAADVGVALGARGATASSQAADMVITVDRLDRLADALDIARRSRRIAVQSVVAGMALSLVAMVFAARGQIPPVAGAALQEAIDVAVILNALRALSGKARRASDESAAGDQPRDEHRDLLPDVNRLRTAADRLDGLSPTDARAELAAIRRFLDERLVPHEKAEDAAVYPVVAKLIGGEDPTSTMSRAHLEIIHLARLYGRLIDELPSAGPGPEDLHELRRVLYGLHAILRLHFAQEEEHYFTLLDEKLDPEPSQRRHG